MYNTFMSGVVLIVVASVAVIAVFQGSPVSLFDVLILFFGLFLGVSWVFFVPKYLPKQV